MAKVPVCFLDLKHRYEFIQHRGRDGPYRIVDLRSLSPTRRDCQARLLECSSRAGVETQSPESLPLRLTAAKQEFLILWRLRELRIGPICREIFLEENIVWVVTEQLSGEMFSDWFSRYISMDSHEERMIIPGLKLIRELLELLNALSRGNIAHNSISKERIYVEVCRCQVCTCAGGTKILLGVVSSVGKERSDSANEASNTLRNGASESIPEISQNTGAVNSTFRRISIRDHKKWWFKLSSFWASQQTNPSRWGASNHFERGNSSQHPFYKMSTNPISLAMSSPSSPRKESTHQQEDIFSMGKIIYEM